MRRASAGEESVGLVARLRARKEEILAAAQTRVFAVAPPSRTTDPEYLEGLKGAVSVALDYALDEMEADGGSISPLPVALLAQARLAARNGVDLETVLRRYLAGYTALGDFIIDEAAETDLWVGCLKRILKNQAAQFDRLIAAVTEDYEREKATGGYSLEQRRVQLVERLLAGATAEAGSLQYDLEGWHLGLVVSGPDARQALEALAAAVDRALLVVRTREGRSWAWLGGRQRIDSERLAARPELTTCAPAAIGEPGQGVNGWRLTHRQARAAFPLAAGDAEAVAYGEVAVLAAAARDDLLMTSLHDLYLRPLRADRDQGVTARDTLRAYFAADHNISSAAASLGVTRHTVASRLRAIEGRLGRPIQTVGAELEIALRLEGRGLLEP